MPEKLGRVAPEKQEQSELRHLAHVHELVAEEAAEALAAPRRGALAHVDRAAEGHRDHATHQPRAQPPWIADAHLRAGIDDALLHRGWELIIAHHAQTLHDPRRIFV